MGTRECSCWSTNEPFNSWIVLQDLLVGKPIEWDFPKLSIMRPTDDFRLYLAVLVLLAPAKLNSAVPQRFPAGGEKVEFPHPPSRTCMHFV